MRFRLILLAFIILFSCLLHAQDPRRFQKEIDTIDLKYHSRINSRDLIVFTGSSSIRRWKNIQDYFPGKNIINTGFGGSQLSDLLFYSDSVIIKYKPIQVFIYEGDNDIAAGKKADAVVNEADLLFKKIIKETPNTQIVIISVKPSVLRWGLKDDYIKLNKLYRKFSLENKNIKFIDVWTPLLNKEGSPKKEIFISDSLHINKLGYDIWAGEIKRFIK